MASNIAGVGRVRVSLLKSITVVILKGESKRNYEEGQIVFNQDLKSSPEGLPPAKPAGIPYNLNMKDPDDYNL
jgi:hypothetical protein